jgi:predicted nucleotidyltransferase
MATIAQARPSADERRVIERLRSALDLEAVWLFGSRARGEGGEDSDEP